MVLSDNKLSDSKLWEYIKRLEGQTMCTLKRRKLNKILRVADNAVEIEKRESKPSYEEITSLYHQVHETGEVISGDALRHARQFTYAVTYAILVKAVPDEIEAIPGKRLGIRLRSQ